MWLAARWKVGALKFLPSPAPDLLSTRKLTNAVSLAAVQTAPMSIVVRRECGGGWRS